MIMVKIFLSKWSYCAYFSLDVSSYLGTQLKRLHLYLEFNTREAHYGPVWFESLCKSSPKSFGVNKIKCNNDNIADEDNGKEIVKHAAKAVGSLSETGKWLTSLHMDMRDYLNVLSCSKMSDLDLKIYLLCKNWL